MTDTTIDVREIPPRERHPLIFSRYDALAPGASLELVNDHDPRPLRYQFEAERGGRFSWDYLEEGPDRWRVRITRHGDADAARGGHPLVTSVRRLVDEAEGGGGPIVLQETEQHRVVVLRLAQGDAITPHDPDVAMTLVVVDGEGEALTSTGVTAIAPGDVVVVPAGEVRAVRAPQAPLVAVVTVSPPPTAHDHQPSSHHAGWPLPMAADAPRSS